MPGMEDVKRATKGTTDAASGMFAGIKGDPTGWLKENFWKKSATGEWAGGAFLLPILLGIMLEKGIGDVGDIMGMKQQRDALQGMGEAITPEAAFYQAMMPEVTGQEQQNRSMLMQQLMSAMGGGGVGGGIPLAMGEELIG